MTAPDTATARPPRRRSVLQVIRTAPRPVWILVVGVFVNRAGAYFSTFLALFLTQAGFALHELPVILLVVGATIPIGATLGGWLGDRLSRKASLVTTTLAAAGGMLVIASAPTRGMTLVGVFIAALFAQSYLPAASALLVDHTPEDDRIPTFALLRLALNLGAATGPVLAVAILPYGMQRLFFISAACSIIFACVLGLGLPRAARGGGAADQSQQASAGPAAASRTGLAVCLASVFCITVVYVQYASSVSLAVASSHDASTYALLLSLHAATVILLELPLSSWTRRLPLAVPLALGTVLMGVGIPVSGAFRPYGIIVVGFLCWTVGEMLFSPVVASAVARLSPGDRVGRYQGYLATVQAMAFGLGPALGTFLYGVRPALLWVGCVVVAAAACVGFLVMGRTTAAAGRAVRGTSVG